MSRPPDAPDATPTSTPATSAADLEVRITELEVKAAFTEDLLDHLNETVARQQQQIDALVREVLALRRHNVEGGMPGFRSLRDEIPPHY